jgi:hypothetical protein
MILPVSLRFLVCDLRSSLPCLRLSSVSPVLTAPFPWVSCAPSLPSRSMPFGSNISISAAYHVYLFVVTVSRSKCRVYTLFVPVHGSLSSADLSECECLSSGRGPFSLEPASTWKRTRLSDCYRPLKPRLPTCAGRYTPESTVAAQRSFNLGRRRAPFYATTGSGGRETRQRFIWRPETRVKATGTPSRQFGTLSARCAVLRRRNGNAKSCRITR